MTTYGFVIDQRRCIGCHACTVACKMEHDVPLGVFRTWVKYVEKGTFPSTRRYFAVLRCNHCEDAPCVRICPTRALYRRSDGIVDFDPSRCIGCKACMQGCPYDALYIDPATHTAAKCNFCAHRAEAGMAPACEIVCPTGAIISGDLDDPSSEIAQLLRREQVSVRAPEQGTRPKLFYVGADDAAITPEASRQADAYLWSEIVPDAQTQMRDADLVSMLAREATTTYNVAHPAPWRWRVSTYLWTKSVAAGAAMLALVALALGHAQRGALGWPAPALALGFVALTGALLVADLKRPERFAYIFLKPNRSSWLVWGAWILVAFSGALVGWIWGDLGPPAVFAAAGKLAAIPLAPLAAAYSGFLFNQAEGRDLWQSKLLAVHLVVMAGLCGAAALALLSASLGPGPDLERLLGVTIAASGAAHLVILLLEYGGGHATSNARLAARNLLRSPLFWAGAALVAASVAAPLALLPAAGASLGGVWLYEHAWIRAGQSVPLS